MHAPAQDKGYAPPRVSTRDPSGKAHLPHSARQKGGLELRSGAEGAGLRGQSRVDGAGLMGQVCGAGLMEQG